MAFVGAVVGEYLGSARGIGYLILEAEGSFNINAVIAGIVVLTVFALLIDTLVTRIERRLLIWQPASGTSAKARADN
jgi:NitT/TauT family transport system permease protein